MVMKSSGQQVMDVMQMEFQILQINNIIIMTRPGMESWSCQPPQQSPNSPKNPLRRTNFTVIDINKQKIKFLNKYLSRSEMCNYATTTAVNQQHQHQQQQQQHQHQYQHQLLNQTNSTFISTSINPTSTSAYVYAADQYTLQYRMKEKFQELYRKIQKIQKNVSYEEVRGGKQDRRAVLQEQEFCHRRLQSKSLIQQDLIKAGYRSRLHKNPRQSQPQHSPMAPGMQSQQCPAHNLQILPYKEQGMSIRYLGNNSRYKNKLVTIAKNNKMSNHIKDYLSVEKIKLKDLQEAIIDKQSRIVEKSVKLRTSLYCDYPHHNITSGVLPILLERQKKERDKARDRQKKAKQKQREWRNSTSTKYLTAYRNKKFQIPFETYFYRDLLWRVAYSNQKILEFPTEYQSKIRVFIGKGNNSRLIKSIITRRSWYQITDKIDDAHFVWTQIKVRAIFNMQPKSAKRARGTGWNWNIRASGGNTCFYLGGRSFFYNFIQNSREGRKIGGNDKKEKEKQKQRKRDQETRVQSVYMKEQIWTTYEHQAFKRYFDAYKNSESRMNQSMKFRNKHMQKLHQKIPQANQTQISQIRNSSSSSQLPASSLPISLYHPTTSTQLPLPSPPPPLPMIVSQSVPGPGPGSRVRIHNHLPNSYLIGNKKALFQTMSDYYAKKGDDVFNYLPLTFHVVNGLEDEKYLKFLNFYYQYAKKLGDDDANNNNTNNNTTSNNNNTNTTSNNNTSNTNNNNNNTSNNNNNNNNTSTNCKYNAWIVKPGQNTNRGNGINVCLTLDSIKNIIKKKQKHADGSPKTYIIQKYIQRPMLYKKRKFDIRHYMMINLCNGHVKGYWFKQGYVRTTSSEYSLKQGHGSVHLTNDAVQKNLSDYGKYQKANKISYQQLQSYISKCPNSPSFSIQIYPKMKKIATDVICACAGNLDPDLRNNFEIYGLDFMIDQNLGVWLIQVNTNPCLQLSCPLLAKIIPKMVENTLEICVDTAYPPPTTFNPKGQTFKKNCVQEMSYELVYDDRFEDDNQSDSRLLDDETLKKEEDDCFEDDGEDWNQD